MKILYIKNNNDRALEYQVTTIIFEKNNIKYVEKRALTKESIPHIQNIINNYQKLQKSICSNKFQLANIFTYTEDSIIFEYIEGISLENIFHKLKEHEKLDFLDNFSSDLKSSFKMSQFSFDKDEMKLQDFFGKHDYRKLNGEDSFDSISNIDFILPNIIKKENTNYIIDYEWTFNFSLPFEYIKYRLYLYHQIPFKAKPIYKEMEDYFFNNVVTNRESFYQYSNQYVLKNLGQI